MIRVVKNIVQYVASFLFLLVFIGTIFAISIEAQVIEYQDNMTHNELTEKAAKWLVKHDANITIPNCPLVYSELKTASREIPDVIGFNSSSSVVLEIKTSRSDFLRDADKHFRIHPELGMGQTRYYVCAKGIVKPSDDLNGWGLIIHNKRGFNIEIKSENFQYNCDSERKLLLSVIRRQKKILSDYGADPKF
jgi:hypothetical protein